MMSHDNDFIRGIIAPAPHDKCDYDKMENDILEDVFYNIIHDLVLQVHREEKTLRANSAAIAIEDIASRSPEGDSSYSQTPSKSPGPSKSPKSPRGPRWRTESAININGDVCLRGNPLETRQQILCSKCHLPQRLEPPLDHAPNDPNIKYCSRRPIVNIPGHDVHGVPFPVTDAKGASRKRQKKDGPPSQTLEPSYSFESPGPPSPTDDITNVTTTNINTITEKKKKPLKKEAYPDVTCKICGYKCAVNIYGRHLSKCMGIGGRASGRAAAQRMMNGGEANGASRGTSTPPVSRRGTPLPPGVGAQKKSPTKRAMSSFDDDDSEEDDFEEKTPKKKRRKKPGLKKTRAEKDNGRDATSGPVSMPQSNPLKIKFKLKKVDGNADLKVGHGNDENINGNGIPLLPDPRDQSSESSHTMSSAL